MKISRRTFIYNTMALAGSCCLAPSLALADPATGKKKNVLLLTIDDLRADLGCYGNPIMKTPHIDAMAAQSMQFNKAYVQMAVCGPSRGSVLTGLRPDTSGIIYNHNSIDKTTPNITTLPGFFKKQGYQCISLGKVNHGGTDDGKSWHSQAKDIGEKYLGKENLAILEDRKAQAKAKKLDPSTRAYRVLVRAGACEAPDIEGETYQDAVIAQQGIQWMKDNPDKPFFMALGFRKPHLPFNAPKRFWDMYPEKEMKAMSRKKPKGTPGLAFTDWGEMRNYAGIPKKGDLDEATSMKLLRGYYACVSFVDEQIGKVMQALKEQDLEKDTVVMLWGDHGYKLGEYGDWCKHTNFELDTHIPLMVKAPGMQGGQSEQLVEALDIYPTLAELAGFTPPKHCEGISMKPLMKDPQRKWKQAAFSQYPRRGVMGYSIRSGDYRCTIWQDKKGKIKDRELYDHSASRFATKNLAKDAAYAETLQALEAIIKAGPQRTIS